MSITLLLALGHRLERGVGAAFGGAAQQAGILDREKALGDRGIERHRPPGRAEGQQQHDQNPVPQHESSVTR
jgi:hypothetical protein